MNDVAEAVRPAQTGAKTVQDYIDELPAWSDGTSLKSAPMTGMQWRIWSLAAAGKFFEGFVVFMTGVALPLIVREFHIGSAEKGIVSAASLAGILIGAVLLGIVGALVAIPVAAAIRLLLQEITIRRLDRS